MKPTCVPFSNGLIELCAAAKNARFSAEKRDRITAPKRKTNYLKLLGKIY